MLQLIIIDSILILLFHGASAKFTHNVVTEFVSVSFNRLFMFDDEATGGSFFEM